MYKTKKRLLLGIGKAVSFFLIFLLLFQCASNIFRTKRFAFSVAPIYNLPRNSVDVIFLGSSHMNTVISPMDLWKDYGITSFNAAIGDQTIPASYFELRELLKIQRPQVVVLEVYHIFQPEMMTSNGEERLHWLVDNVPMSGGVSEAIQTLISEDSDKTEYYLNFYSFHNRWKALKAEDFLPVENDNMGADMSLYGTWSERETPIVIPRETIKEPPELPVQYLHKIIDLCRENGIQLILMASPCFTGEDLQSQLNFVGQLAEREKVPFLNFFYLLEDTGFDFSQDMAESSHMNYGGVQKITAFVGRYLRGNYHLEDYRNFPETASLWDTAYQRYSRVLCNALLKRAVSMKDYFAQLEGQDYVLALYAYSGTPLTETKLSELLETYGAGPQLSDDENYYCALIRQGTVVSEASASERINRDIMLEDVQFSFGDGINGSQNPIAIHVGRTEYAKGKQGLNLVVYDPMTRTVADSINVQFDSMTLVR